MYNDIANREIFYYCLIEVFMFLGTRLKTLRKQANMSQSDLGKVLGLSCTAISQYESETRFPDCETLKEICEFFNVSSDFLLGLIETQTSPLKNGRIVVDCEGFTEEQMETLHFLINSFNAINKRNT